jgi:hypothetical protein
MAEEKRGNLESRTLCVPGLPFKFVMVVIQSLSSFVIAIPDAVGARQSSRLLRLISFDLALTGRR